jgi:hypothetical protein
MCDDIDPAELLAVLDRTEEAGAPPHLVEHLRSLVGPIAGHFGRGIAALSIRLDANPGCTIWEIADAAIDVARRTGHPVGFRFNGFEVTCVPGMTDVEVVAEYGQVGPRPPRLLFRSQAAT